MTTATLEKPTKNTQSTNQPIKHLPNGGFIFTDLITEDQLNMFITLASN